MTPVLHVGRTQAGAVSWLKRQFDGIEVEGRPAATGGWHSVALLRSDQEWLRQRLEERGALCEQADPAAAHRHVSQEMIRAGAEVLSAPTSILGERTQADLVRRIYTAMESAR